MSNWQDQLGGEEETQALVDWLVAYYHYPAVLAIIVFAFVNRVRNYSNFIVDGEVLYSGNDPWYHMRSTEYVIDNFPETMPFDPWTFFPHGTANSQFGTLFDQLIALVALVVGLGSPSEGTGRLVILIAPAVFGALVAVPAYFIGKRLGGRFGGVVSVLFVALAPDRLLDLSLAGVSDHHAAEALFLGFAVLGLMVALRAAETELPAHELLLDREFGLIRGTLGWSILAGVALGVYMWVWPPGVWLYGIFGVFFVLHMIGEHYRGRSPEHTAFVGAITFATAGVLQLAAVQDLGLSATGRTLLQPGLGFVTAGGVVALAWFSREVHRRDISSLTYPAGIAASLAGGGLLVALLLPGLFSFFFDQFDRSFGATIDWLDTLVWFADLSTEAGGAATIGEGQPGDLDTLQDSYQFATFTALLGAVGLVFNQILDDRPKGEELLLVVVSAFLVIATLTQVRFAYYLTLVIGGLNAALVGYIMRFAGTPDTESLPETYQILTIFVVVMVMFVPLLGLPLVGGDNTAINIADDGSQPGDVTGWADSLDWMAENTPEPGTFGDPDGEPLEYYGEYDRTDDFDHPNGSYGVLSWWDYGHWITTKGERIPNANPFQQNVVPAARFLLAQDEGTALDILKEEDFRDGESAQTRYVMVDSLMVESETLVGGKLFAPADFHPEFERGDFYRRITSDSGSEGIINKQAYYESMMVRLYHFHGSEASPGVGTNTERRQFVSQWSGQEARTGGGSAIVDQLDGANQSTVRFVNDLSAAQNITENNPSAQIGGIGANPAEEVDALKQFRLVYADEVPAVSRLGGNDRALSQARDNGLSTGPAIATIRQDLSLFDAAQNSTLENDQSRLDALYRTTPSFTKTFERVPGATIEGSLPDNATGGSALNLTAGDQVSLSVPIEPENGQEFSYSQTVTLDENLEFTTTVPYSTTGYDEWGPEEGYTNVSTRANGSYTVRTGRGFDANTSELVSYSAQFNVTEGQVIGEEDPTVEVELEEQRTEFNIGGGGNSGGDGGDSSNGGDGGDGGDGSDGSSSDSGDGGSGVASSIVVDTVGAVSPDTRQTVSP